MSAHPTIPEPVNVVVRALLRSPLHRAMSHNTMLLSITGRKTGHVYQVPISYSRDGDHLVCYTDAPWWKNLRGGATVTAVIRGQRRPATAQAISGPAVAEHLARHLRVVSRDAKYHGVRLVADREPDLGDLARAAETTVMIRIRIGDPHREE